VEEVRDALRRYAPRLADAPIEFLGEGWAMWAYRAGDYVLRLPMRETAAVKLSRNHDLLRELAQSVSVRIAAPEVYAEDGPQGLPFTAHRFIPGVSLIEAASLLPASARGGKPAVRPAPTFGDELGIFLRQLHGFPVERAVALGGRVEDGAALRADRIAFYEDIVRRVFPLVSCEARSYTKARFEAYLNDAANFVFEPRLIHSDLDRQNIIIDAATGSLTGVIDFDNVRVGKPAIDLWLALVDFEKLGIDDQLSAFLEAYGDPGLDLERARVEADFVQFLWPFHDITFGLWTENQDLVEDGIRALNESLPRDLRCP
jgi:aminoglycoside 2''-phosphotransferase